MITSKDLNDNQNEAIQWRDGPLLVLAGPGSGKTTVLTLHVAQVLQENENAGVLALTFTNKAAAEMKERVGQLLDKPTERVRLCTFHKFAVQLLGQHGGHIGLQPNFDLLTRNEDRIVFIKEVVKDLFGRYHQLPEDSNQLLRSIDQLFSESYSEKENSPSSPKRPEWLPTLFKGYCDVLLRANCQDFGSLLYFANRLLHEKPVVAEIVNIAWTHICVDEFQDTNRAQYELLRHVAPNRRSNLLVVADDDQLIYQWNGASLQRLSDLRQDYELHTLQLPENYRCPREIVEHANRLIAHNTRRKKKKNMVYSCKSRHSSTKVDYKAFNSLKEEAEFIAQDIRTRGLKPGDCVVLGRTSRLVQSVARELPNLGLSAFVPENKKHFDSPVLGVMVEVLRLAKSRHDRIILQRLCQQWYLHTDGIIEPQAVEAAATLVGGDFLRAWIDFADITPKDQENRYLLKLIRDNLVEEVAFLSVVDQFLDHLSQSSNGQAHGESMIKEVDIWKDQHREIVEEHGSAMTLNSYMRNFDFLPKTSHPETDSVQCVTIHRSKGLQFKHVYLIGMAQEVFPSYWALKKGANSEEMEEERRSCFVAITRAQETLTLTGSGEYFGYSKTPSQFLGEMGVCVGLSKSHDIPANETRTDTLSLK